MELKKLDIVYVPAKVDNNPNYPLQIKLNGVWHWLKPIKDVYVLTEDELKKFVRDAIQFGYTSIEDSYEEDAKKFLNSITK